MLRADAPAAENAPPPPTQADRAWQAAQRPYNARRWQQAEEAYEAFRSNHRADPRAAEAHYRMGVCARNRGQQTRALEIWRDVLRFSGHTHPAERQARLRAATALYEHHPGERNRSEREHILAGLARELGHEHEAVVKLYVTEARDRIESGDLASAARLYGAVEASLSALDQRFLAFARSQAGRGIPDVRIIIDLADHLLAINEPAQATAFYELALKSNPTREQAWQIRTRLGWALYLQQELDRAERLWRQVITEAPEGNEWRGRARWHLIQLASGERRNPRRAISLGREQADEFQDSPLGEQGLFAYAWLLKVTSQWEQAHKAYNEMIAHYPLKASNPHILTQLAEIEAVLEKKAGDE